MIAETATTEARQQQIMQEFSNLGLDPTKLWEPDAANPVLGLRVLEEIMAWVKAYTLKPNRRGLAAMGLEYPPVNPDCDPETDWVRFERWIQRKPLTWSFCREFGPLQPLSALTPAEVQSALSRVERLLGDRGVVVDIDERVPPAARYEYLCRELNGSEFEFTSPETTTHLTGCGGDCESCFQLAWCDTGLDEVELAEEDEQD